MSKVRIYLGEAQSTRQIKKYMFTGNEAIQQHQGSYIYYITPYGDDAMMQAKPVVCSHFPYYDGGAANAPNNSVFTKAGAQISIWFRVDNYTTVADFKTYLQQQYAAGTPVTVWYVLATPETAVVNEPLQKIGDYADTLSNISIPVTAGANTISVDTTLQPSEVTVNYKGWHPVADVHERENGAWT